MRVLRHHRDLRPAPAAEERRADRGRARGAARLGMEIVFIVDDNFIGNKKAVNAAARVGARMAAGPRLPVRSSLPKRRSTWPKTTQLMQLMVDANILSVFIGIESPERSIAPRDQEAPERAARPARSSSACARCRTAGLEVWSGMILGFDHDDETIFDAAARVPRGGPHRASDDRHVVRRSRRPRCTRGSPPPAGSIPTTTRPLARTSSRHASAAKRSATVTSG